MLDICTNAVRDRIVLLIGWNDRDHLFTTRYQGLVHQRVGTDRAVSDKNVLAFLLFIQRRNRVTKTV